MKEKARKLGHYWYSRSGGVRYDLSLDNWNLEAGSDGLQLYGKSLNDLRKRWGTPLHVVDIPRLRTNYEAFKSVHQKNIEPCDIFLSYKTNPVPGVLHILHELGAGAEVISEYELWLALKLGVRPIESSTTGRQSLMHP
jgi:diaminopimelate decarboxylase